MAGWAGFTDEDLMQIKQTTSPGPSVRQSSSNATKQALVRKQKIQQQRELARQRAQDFAQGQNNSPLPRSQRLSSPSAAQPLSKEEPKVEAEAQAKEKAPNPSDAVHSEEPDEESKVNANGHGDGKESEPGVKEIDGQEGLRVELNRIEQFRIQQQKMEKENKQRQRILADAIKQRSKMAKEEAEKLTKVQKELNHLDSLVTADVSIIRDKIEAASFDFLQAQKRYEKAEKEFVDAKIALAEKSDLKESLTEHLYTVIQQNEARKAERLAVLMKQLGMESADYTTTLTVPPLLSFSPINTLHRPHFPPIPPCTPASPETAGAPGADLDKSSPELSAKDSGVAQEQASEQCKDRDTSPPADLSARGAENTHTLEETGDACVKAAEAEIQKEKSVDSSTEDSEKAAENVKQTTCAENGNPESQDGGADTTLVVQ